MYARRASTLNTNQKETHEYEKRGDWMLPVPRTEALRLPCQSERATIDPTPICTAHPTKVRSMHIYIPMGIYRCSVL